MKKDTVIKVRHGRGSQRKVIHEREVDIAALPREKLLALAERGLQQKVGDAAFMAEHKGLNEAGTIEAVERILCAIGLGKHTT